MESAVENDPVSINPITFAPSDEQREIVAVARAFAAERMRPAAEEMQRAMSEHGFGAWKLPEGLVAEAAQAGLLSYAIPEAVGGGGLDALSSAMVMEELAVGDPGL